MSLPLSFHFIGQSEIDLPFERVHSRDKDADFIADTETFPRAPPMIRLKGKSSAARLRRSAKCHEPLLCVSATPRGTVCELVNRAGGSIDYFTEACLRKGVSHGACP